MGPEGKRLLLLLNSLIWSRSTHRGLLAWRAAAIPQLAVKNTDFVEKMVTNFIYD
jgi:hypothetical protein